MTVETTETPVKAPEGPVEPQTDLPEGTDTGEESGGNREARYRIRAREAEAERDALAQRLEKLQRSEVERLAAEHLAAPGDISLAGKQLNEFLTPEGWVDHEAVAAAAASVVQTRPGLARDYKSPATDRSQGLGDSGQPQSSWEALLKS